MCETGLYRQRQYPATLWYPTALLPKPHGPGTLHPSTQLFTSQENWNTLLHILECNREEYFPLRLVIFPEEKRVWGMSRENITATGPQLWDSPWEAKELTRSNYFKNKMSTLLPDLDFLYKVAQLHIFKSVTLRGKETHQKGLLKQDEK